MSLDAVIAFMFFELIDRRVLRETYSSSPLRIDSSRPHQYYILGFKAKDLNLHTMTLIFRIAKRYNYPLTGQFAVTGSTLSNVVVVEAAGFAPASTPTLILYQQFQSLFSALQTFTAESHVDVTDYKKTICFPPNYS